MTALSAFVREYFSMGLIGLAIAVTVAYAIFRAVNVRARNRRRAAWQAQRTEEDRIWSERTGDN